MLACDCPRGHHSPAFAVRKALIRCIAYAEARLSNNNTTSMSAG